MLQGARRLLGRGALRAAGALFRVAGELDELAEARLGVTVADEPAPAGEVELDYGLVWGRLPESYDLIDLGPVAVVTGRN